MHLLYCDETNLEPKDNDFFVYGGLVVEGNAALNLSQEVDRIRRNIPRDYVLKFNPGPPHLSHRCFIGLKQAVIEAAVENGCTLLVAMILHNIATTPDEARRNEINRVCLNFDSFLRRRNSHGLVLIDRFEDRKIDKHLRQKFSIGLTGLPFSRYYRLERIVGFHYSAIGQSHFSSIVDVVLGSLRFSVNAFTRGQDEYMGTATELLQLLSPLFLRSSKGLVPEISLCFDPKTVRWETYRDQYEALKRFLTEQGIEPEQKITGERGY